MKDEIGQGEKNVAFKNRMAGGYFGDLFLSEHDTKKWRQFLTETFPLFEADASKTNLR